MPINSRRYFSEIEEASGPLDPSHPEFDALVRARMGPEFASLFNPAEKAQSMVVGDPTAEYTTLGMNFRPDTPIERIREVLEPVTHETRTWSRDLPERKPQVIPKGKRIFGLGAGATPQTWAHEYRHNRLHPGNTLDDAETLNRVYDILYASTSLPAYRTQIRRAHSAFFEWDPSLSFEERMTLRQLPDADKEERVLHMVAAKSTNSASNVPFLSGLRSAFRSSDLLPKNPSNVIRYNYELNKKGAVGGFLGNKQLSSDVIDYRARYPFLNFIGRLGEDVEKFAEGGEVQAEPTESPLEAARRIRDSLISSSQRFAEGGEVKKDENPMASPVGGAKQMLAELESEDKKIAERKRPRSKESIEEERASKELDRGTLMSGSLVAPTIAREGELTVRRFAGGGSADKGKLTLVPVGGVEFGPANPAPRSLKDFVPGAADLPRSPPQKAPGWGDAAAYNPQGLAYGFGTGVRNTLEGLAALPGTAADLLKGFAQREIRERSPEGMRGSAPAMDTTAYDAAKSALKEAAGNPVEAARNIRDSLVSYVRQGVATPQSTAQFIGENVNPLPKVGPRAGPVSQVVKKRGGNWVQHHPTASAEELFAEPKESVVFGGYGDRNVFIRRQFEKLSTTTPQDAIKTYFGFTNLDGAGTAVDNWVKNKLRKYVTTEMGTADDPLLKLIDEERISHIPIRDLNEADVGAGSARMSYRSSPTYGEALPHYEDAAKTHAGAVWETMSGDTIRGGSYATRVSRAQSDYPSRKDDLLRSIGGDFAVANPKTAAYSLVPDTAERLNFDHLVHELLNSVRSGSDLPPNLRMSPEDLAKLSVPDAVRKVHAINRWRASEASRANLHIANNPATRTFIQYPLPGDDTKLGEGYRWDSLELPKDMSREEGAKFLREALDYEGRVMGHCAGSYCDTVMNAGTNIISLRNATTGEPHVTVEISPADDGSIGRIVQIKGKSNKAPVNRYRPMVLQMLRTGDFSRTYGFRGREDLQNARIVDLHEYPDDQNMVVSPGKPLGQVGFRVALDNINRFFNKSGSSNTGSHTRLYNELLSELSGAGVKGFDAQEALAAVQVDLAKRVSERSPSGPVFGGHFGHTFPSIIQQRLPRFMSYEEIAQEAKNTLRGYMALTPEQRALSTQAPAAKKPPSP